MKLMEVSLKSAAYLQRTSACWKGPAYRGRKDLLRRFTPTPYGVDLLIMAKTVRLESNSLAVIENAREFFARHEGQPRRAPELLWRIVSQEHGPRMNQAGVALSAFSDRGLRFANIGHRSFLAVDLDAGEGIGFVDESLVEPEPKLNCRPVFDTLFCMSAGSLGMVPLSAACVGLGEKGILIFGPPNSGKTTTSYLAARLGLEFHADQAVFLDAETGELRAWGDLLPAIFRTESLQFLPELRASTRRFSYPGLTVHYLPKHPFQATKAHPVAPMCSVFLNPVSTSEPHLAPIVPAERFCRFTEYLLFKDDERFQQQTSTILRFLGQLPAYELTYAGDPAIAAQRVAQMLMVQDIGRNRPSGPESRTTIATRESK
jgi:hypothetical protein